jgi:hypothetical protein
MCQSGAIPEIILDVSYVVNNRSGCLTTTDRSGLATRLFIAQYEKNEKNNDL